MDLDPARAVVLLSGGQDSATCLAWAKRRFARVWALSFDYGQRHRVERDAAARIAGLAGVEVHRVLKVSELADLGDNALTGPAAVEEAAAPGRLPNTFVPGRNLLFLTLAGAWAWQLGAGALVAGVCQTDYSGYPDCRQDTLDALQEALRRGLDAPTMTIHAPLMHLSKAQSVVLARDLGALDLLAWTHSCYNGAVPPCGRCPACHLRAKGFAEAGIPDPLLVRLGGA